MMYSCYQVYALDPKLSMSYDNKQIASTVLFVVESILLISKFPHLIFRCPFLSKSALASRCPPSLSMLPTPLDVFSPYYIAYDNVMTVMIEHGHRIDNKPEVLLFVGTFVVFVCKNFNLPTSIHAILASTTGDLNVLIGNRSSVVPIVLARMA